MKRIFAYFAARRYWGDDAELNAVYGRLSVQLAPLATESRLIVDGEGVDTLPAGDNCLLVVVPMSGAVQKYILAAAARYKCAVLYAAYVEGNSDAEAAGRMLYNNAAPTVMDSWAVLRKSGTLTRLALDRAALEKNLTVLEAYSAVKGARLLLVGEPEPWVISVSRNYNDYEKLGITVQQLPQQQVADLYAATTNAEGEPYYQKYKNGAATCKEPTDDDLRNAGRMTAALLKLLEKYNADGMALACFNLLSLGTTSCLGVSYINDCTGKVAACEGDIDSAVTLLMLKQLSNKKLWMANPGLHPGGLVNFSHCTAPLDIDGEGDRPFTLRNHHESGIGASLQVDLPAQRRLTACRISGKNGLYTVMGGTSQPGPYEPACRTQLYVRFDDFDGYINTALGCHQVFCFEDVAESFATLAELLGLARERA